MSVVPAAPSSVTGQGDLRHQGGRWALCQQDGNAESLIPADDAWTDIPEAGTVASVWRRLGRWHIDDAPTDFDAHVWWFRLTFDAAPDQAAGWRTDARHALHFAGLAGACEVWFNGQSVLQSDNMFTSHTVPVQNLIQPSGNVLTFRFASLRAALGRKRPRPRWRTPMVSHQQLRWFRTTLLGRTPGWSVPAAPVGPWRAITLTSSRKGDLHSATVVSSMDADDGLLTVSCRFHEAAPHVQRLRVAVRGPDGQQVFSVAQRACDAVEAVIRLPAVVRWWPNTHGRPTLYAVSLWVTQEDGTERQISLRDVGFRAVTQIAHQPGFALAINGQPVFCRGACWMPIDVVSLGADADRYRQALTQVRDAGMNMLRIPGSTVYEDPVFYDLCDELGIMVWQDLMFSNMDYPVADPDFAANCMNEVRQQAAWMKQHPCVVVVCGNSEVEQQAAMWGAPKSLWQSELFHEHIPQWLEADSLGAVYWPSSAHGGAFPHQPEAGTCSYYGVGAYKRDLSDALSSKVSFATECLALANIPPTSTLRRSPAGESPQVHSPAWKSRVYRDLSVGWDFDDVREHYVERLTGLRPDELRAVDPARHLTLGRAISAEVMGRTMALWRTSASPCTGALVWFLRDLWPGAGCGLVDDLGEAKSVMHALRRVQQPRLAVVEDRGLNGLVLHLINETDQPVDGLVEVALYQHGEIELARKTLPVAVSARGDGQWPLTDWLDAFMDVNWTYRFGPASVDLVVVDWKTASGQLVNQALHCDTRQLVAFDGDPGLKAVATRAVDGRVSVEISTRAAAYGLHFDTLGWTPSDEFFHLPPGGSHTVEFTPHSKGVSAPLWFASVRSLNSRVATPVVMTSGQS